MKVPWTRKNFFVYIWVLVFGCIGLMIYDKVGELAGSQHGENFARKNIGETLVLESLAFLYPVMEYPQNPQKQSFIENVVAKTCFGAFPLAEYVSLEGERSVYATQMESQLSEKEIEEILAMEAADENNVSEDGEIMKAQGSAAEDETQIAQHVLEQFALENQTAQTAGGNVGSSHLDAGTIVGQEYSAEMLNYDFLINHFYTVDSTTKASESQLDASKLLAKDMSMKGDNSKPQILIYHTHSQEGFVDSVEGDTSTTIVGVGAYLTKLLQEKGYNVIHNTKAYDLVDGKLDRNEAYSLALPDIEKILEENPSIEVVIDLHRDGIEGNKLVTDVNGKPTAQFMFFNGLSYTNKNGAIDYLANPNLEDNLAFSLQLQLEAAKYYPGVTRKIYLKGYRYNLHVCPKALLVESGAQNNTVQEQLNAMEVLADILHKVLAKKS